MTKLASRIDKIARKLSRRPRHLPADSPAPVLENFSDLQQFLALTLDRVQKGTLDVKVTGTVSNLAGVLLKSLQTDVLTKISERLDRLEEMDAADDPPGLPPAETDDGIDWQEFYRQHPVEGCIPNPQTRVEQEANGVSVGPADTLPMFPDSGDER